MERFLPDQWAPPWLRHEHVGRYAWVGQFSPGCVVLDAACGDGYGAEALIRAGAASVYGFDISQEAIEQACQRHAADNRIRFAVGDVVQLPLPDHHVDLYVSFETIEHVVDDRGLLAEAARVLKPNGRFICSTPNREVVNPGNVLADRPGNPYHIREYSPEEFETLLRSYFGRVDGYGQTFLPGPYCRLLGKLGGVNRKFARRCHQAQKVFGLLWRSARSHYPVSRKDGRTPEVLIAVCAHPQGS